MATTSYDTATKSGWWASTPYDVIKSRTGTTDSRLIIPFTDAANACFADDADISLAIPTQLAAKGVTQEEWNGVAGELVAVQHSTLGACASGLLLLSIILIPVYCVVRSNYQAHLATWLDKLNSAHLQPRGMLARFQSLTVPRGKSTQKYSWLAIALTPEESAQLASEPAFWVPEDCSCCDANPGRQEDQCADCQGGCGAPRVI